MHGVWGWLGPQPNRDARALLADLAPDTRHQETLLDPFQTKGTLAARSWQGEQAYAIDDLLVGFTGRPEISNGNTQDGPALAAWLGESYRRTWIKSSLLERLSGPFALAILDLTNQEALLAVDRMGIWDLAYGTGKDCLVFGPRADRVANDPRIQASINLQGIFSYLYHHTVPRPESVFQGVYRLRPGQMVIFHQGQIEAKAYWAPGYSEDNPKSRHQLQERFRATLRTAVRRAAKVKPAGAFLSGGTDSSTITGMLGEVTGEPPRTFAIGFNEPGYDETEYARITARHFNAQHREYFVTPQDVVTAIPTIAASYDQPYGNASVIPSLYCARLAREEGIRTLLGGDGGDELFAGNERYAKQWIFSLYERVPQWLQKGVLEPMANLPGGDRVPPIQKARRYIEQANLPLAERWQSYNLLEFIGVERVLTQEFLSEVDPGQPMAELRREFQNFQDNALVNQLMGVDLKYTLADDDLRKIMGAGELAGIETRFPFLDEEVVELASELPPDLKMKRTRLRHFFKEALRDYLPKETLAKEKQGFGLPFGVWLREKGELQDLAFDSLAGLRHRGIIRPALIDELIENRMEEHAAFFGTLVWVLMMLEQWFQSRY